MHNIQEFKAVVWDMDGLIFDTERLSYIAWKAGAKAVGMEVDLAFFQSIIGMNSRAIQARIQGKLGPDVDVAELTRVAGLEYDRLIRKGPPLKAGAKECITLLSELGVPQALATSSSYRYASRKLIHHGLLPLLNEIVSGDQVTHGKPHPEPYLTAAQRLGIDPQRCIAFEDSVNGIRSAREAGMYTVLIPDMCPHNEESLQLVCEQFNSLEDAKTMLEKVFDRS